MILLIAWGSPAAAQRTADAQARSVAKMRAGIEKQLQSVRRQAVLFETLGTLAATAPLATGDCDPLDEADLQSVALSAAQPANVDPLLVRAIIEVESGGRPCAVSPKGAQGLMQLMPAAQSDFGVTTPFDPAANAGAGARYLRQLLDRYNGEIPLALAAYNAGPARVTGSVPDIRETREYVARVQAAHARLRRDDSQRMQ